jgi:putative ABC transport system permease protein
MTPGGVTPQPAKAQAVSEIYELLRLAATSRRPVAAIYGVLDYAVVGRRREFGIRIALGAGNADIARRVTIEVFSMLLVGSACGLALGLGSARYIATLLYQVKPTDARMLALPAFTILSAALFAALPPVLRAIGIDPSEMLRAE